MAHLLVSSAVLALSASAVQGSQVRLEVGLHRVLVMKLEMTHLLVLSAVLEPSALVVRSSQVRLAVDLHRVLVA